MVNGWGKSGSSDRFYFLFLKYKFIYFNWRLITLKYCIGFAIHQHESAMGFGLCGRGKGWDDLEEWHRNMYNII